MEKAGDILKLFLEKQNIKAARSYTSFFRSWECVAGEDISSHSRILDIQKGTLLVEVDHPAWIQIIQMKYKAILNNVQSSFPELSIERMHITLSTTTSPEVDEKKTRDSNTKTAGETDEERENNTFRDALKQLKESIEEKEKRKRRNS